MLASILLAVNCTPPTSPITFQTEDHSESINQCLTTFSRPKRCHYIFVHRTRTCVTPSKRIDEIVHTLTLVTSTWHSLWAQSTRLRTREIMLMPMVVGAGWAWDRRARGCASVFSAFSPFSASCVLCRRRAFSAFCASSHTCQGLMSDQYIHFLCCGLCHNFWLLWKFLLWLLCIGEVGLVDVFIFDYCVNA